MTAARAFCILSGALCSVSIYYNKRDILTVWRLLFLAYSMLAIGVIAMLHQWNVL